MSFGSSGIHLNNQQKGTILRLFYKTKLFPSAISQRLGVSTYTVKRTIRSQLFPKNDQSKIQPTKTEHLPIRVTNFIDSVIEASEGEVTAKGIQTKVLERFRIELSQSTVNRVRRRLGWIRTGSRYCQLVNRSSVPVRLAWALQALISDDRFSNTIEIDETSVVLNPRTRTISYRRSGQGAYLKPLPKHSLKVHLLGGISRLGKTPLIIFQGNLNSEFLIEIFQTSIIPWIKKVWLFLIISSVRLSF